MRRYLVSLCSLLLFQVLAVAALADVSHLVNYQGFLMYEVPPGGAMHGTYDLLFEILPDSCSGTPLWDEYHHDVNVVHGVFNVILGGIEPITADVFALSDRWMRVTVPGVAEELPCMVVTSVPWALHAAVADSVSNSPSGFCDRGDVSAYDFYIEDFIVDNTWHGLDLSTIVPPTARAVLLAVEIADDNIDGWFQLAKYGHTGGNNISHGQLQVANHGLHYDAVVQCGPDGMLQYRAWSYAPPFNSIRVLVKGWWR